MAHYIGKQSVGRGFPRDIYSKALDNAWAGGELLDAQRGENIRESFLSCGQLADFFHGTVPRKLICLG